MEHQSNVWYEAQRCWFQSGTSWFNSCPENSRFSNLDDAIEFNKTRMIRYPDENIQWRCVKKTLIQEFFPMV